MGKIVEVKRFLLRLVGAVVLGALCIGPVPRLLNARDSFLNAIGLFIVVTAFLFLATVGFEEFRKWYFKKDKEGGNKQ
jgi:hypothetical protein